ncbi:thymidine phosphorylase [Chloroflexota bacterium]
MQATDIIIKKRDKGELSKEEINFLIKGFTNGEIPDYQVSAWAMAVTLNGMSDREVTDLTLAMVNSGEILDMSQVVKISVDKHSTGGVGDKTSLVVLPIVAACGLAVGKMSGRGLGFSGGTLDKMEAIPGFRTDLTSEEVKKQLQAVGLVLTGQSSSLAPADGKLYALRDVTGTVPSIPLIASSIMSKKIAAGSQAMVLDVKTGMGAFMEHLSDARKLGDIMTRIGELADKKVVVILSDMNQPLGYAIGNSLEVRESIDTLQGNGPADLLEHCLVVSAHMLLLGEITKDFDEARKMAENVISKGTAFAKFRDLVQAQGGDISFVEDPRKFPDSSFTEDILAKDPGFISLLNARLFGEASVILGAGRKKKGDSIEHSVGIVVHRKVGDSINEGECLYTIHANDESKLNESRKFLEAAVEITKGKVDPLPLFYE